MKKINLALVALLTLTACDKPSQDMSLESKGEKSLEKIALTEFQTKCLESVPKVFLDLVGEDFVVNEMTPIWKKYGPPTDHYLSGDPLTSVYDVLTDYSENEVRADLKYKGKKLRLLGTVHEISKSALGTIHLILGTHTTFSDDLKNKIRVIGFKDSEQYIGGINKGDHIALFGECRGLILGELQFIDCEAARNRRKDLEKVKTNLLAKAWQSNSFDKVVDEITLAAYEKEYRKLNKELKVEFVVGVTRMVKEIVKEKYLGFGAFIKGLNGLYPVAVQYAKIHKMKNEYDILKKYFLLSYLTNI